MILKNGFVVCDDFKIRKTDIRVENGKITEIGENLLGEDERDFSGKYILPGFIDTHIHGACGTRVTEEDFDLDKMATFEASVGVTGFVPTTTTNTIEDISKQVENIASLSASNKGAKVYGIHMEGPFICEKYKGAMNPEYIIAPDIEKLDLIIEKGKGLVKMITLAPENEGATELIKYASEKGLYVSMGHTNATYDEAKKGIEAGAKGGTHTFNAMRAYNHREPGILGAVLTDDRVKCEMICDHVHLHPVTMELIYKLKGADNISIISDSGHAAGSDIKEFTVDGLKRYVKDGVIRLSDGTIAGSAKTMADGVKNLILSGVSICDVSKMASKNPAETLGVYEETGSIKVGKYADIVILDNEYNVVTAFVSGKEYKK